MEQLCFEWEENNFRIPEVKLDSQVEKEAVELMAKLLITILMIQGEYDNDERNR